MMNATWTQTLLRDQEARAFATKQVDLRHPTVFIANLRVARIVASFITHDVDVADQLEAGRVSRNNNLTGFLVWAFGFWICDSHHDCEAGALGRRSKPLVPVDDIVMPILHRAGAHPGRI